MSLLPRSLFSRMVLVLLGGLLVAQLLSFAIHMHERGVLIAQASGMQSAQRIADIVRLLEPMTPEERRKIVRVLSAPPLTISLERGPLVASREDGGNGARAALFAAMLGQFLADGRPVSVIVTESAPLVPGMKRGFKGGEGHEGWMPMVRHAEQPGISFVAQLRLQDGALATFDTRQPQATASWPYRLLLSIVVLLVAVIAVSLLAVRWVTRPLKALADAAEELGKNINRPPLQEKGPLEVVRAARAFNTMQSRLAGYIRDRMRVLAAMSHDLKTPVTRLRLRSELLEDAQLRAKFTADLQEMESMVASTLDFLRGMESGEEARPVDIMALLESVQADMMETGGKIIIHGKTFAPYPGQPQALKRCLVNLIDNAIKYGGSATVAVDDNADRLELRIADEGPGLAPEELEKVFDPFYRVEGSRNRDTGGTGLGLTIARNVAQAHGGSLVLHNRAAGGVEAVLVLPRPVASSRQTPGIGRQPG
jgi:signal transduction histidine kinase